MIKMKANVEKISYEEDFLTNNYVAMVAVASIIIITLMKLYFNSIAKVGDYIL